MISPGSLLDDTWVGSELPAQTNRYDPAVVVSDALKGIGLIKFDLLELPQGVLVLDAFLQLEYLKRSLFRQVLKWLCMACGFPG